MGPESIPDHHLMSQTMGTLHDEDPIVHSILGQSNNEALKTQAEKAEQEEIRN